jgi:hypothetical protein
VIKNGHYCDTSDFNHYQGLSSKEECGKKVYDNKGVYFSWNGKSCYWERGDCETKFTAQKSYTLYKVTGNAIKDEPAYQLVKRNAICAGPYNEIVEAKGQGKVACARAAGQAGNQYFIYSRLYKTCYGHTKQACEKMRPYNKYHLYKLPQSRRRRLLTATGNVDWSNVDWDSFKATIQKTASSQCRHLLDDVSLGSDGVFKYKLGENSKMAVCIATVARLGQSPEYEANGAKLKVFQANNQVHYTVTINGQSIQVANVNDGSRRRRLLQNQQGGC